MNILKEIVKNIVIKNRREREIKKEPWANQSSLSDKSKNVLHVSGLIKNL